MSPGPDSPRVHFRRREALQRRLLGWASHELRDLPWRHTRDAWSVLVSEVMLHQTQVARIKERWPAFMRMFPTPADTAFAGAAAVVREWEGLGYNRRAIALHGTAAAIVERHGGIVPAECAELEALPGVGPYTARAVLAFAFDRDVAVVDVNAARVLSRAVAGRPLSARDAQHVADDLVPDGAGWVWNQAILDLGATVCTRRDPDCTRCPLRPVCAWRRDGDRTSDPARGGAHAGRAQGRFEGSDRQARGRIVQALRVGPVPDAAVAAAAGLADDPERAHRLVVRLERDGLVRHRHGVWHLG